MTFALRSDLPDPRPRFGTDLIADVLARLLAEPQDGSLVLGLHGSWGSGKSTLMGAIARALAQTEPAPIFVGFNAWKYQDREALWRALIIAVLAALRREIEDWEETARQAKKREIGELERSLYSSFTTRENGSLQVNWTGLATETVLTAIRLAGGGLAGGLVGQIGGAFRRYFDTKEKGGADKDVTDSMERVGKVLQREVVERSVQQVQAIDQFLERYQRLAEDLGKSGKRIYVLIDDLDRCLPDEALTIFEAIKLFLDAKECRYVVAVDRSMIRRGLALRYDRSPQAVDPDEYIEKTISVSFDLPQLDATQARELLQSVELGDGDASEWHAAIIATLGTNPRRLKRAANSLQIMRALATKGGRTLTEEESKLFLKLGLLAYRNSAAFEAICRDPALGVSLQGYANQSKTPAELRLSLGEPIRPLADDGGFWRLLRTKPDLTDPLIRKGSAWFQPGGSP